MSKKKKKKNHTNINNFEVSKKFFKEVNDFFYIKSEDEKYEKALKVIQNIPNIKNIRKIDELLYYSNLGALYFYISKIKCKRYNFSDGKRYNVDNILDKENKNNLEEVINDKIKAFNYYKNSINFELVDKIREKMCNEVKHMSKEEIAKRVMSQYDTDKENFRIISQDLSMIYYLINDEENFILYGNYAVENNSLNAMYTFLKYYCDKMDFDNAIAYYEMIHTFPPFDFYGDPINNIALKIAGHKFYEEFLFKMGKYEESMKVGHDCIEFILNYKVDTKYIEYFEDHIKKCEQKIHDINNNSFNYNLLLKYFEKEIIELMSDDIKIYILTSLNIYEYIKQNKSSMDYSATLMPILKAIENIMFEIVGKKYHAFIQEKQEIRKDLIAAFLNKRQEIKKEICFLDLGTALSLIGKTDAFDNNVIIPNKYFIEFCNKNNVTNSRNVIITIYKELDKIRYNRNLVAHKDRVGEDCVEICYSILLEKFKLIKYLYNNFRFVFEK